jgi:hypothetical protein
MIALELMKLILQLSVFKHHSLSWIFFPLNWSRSDSSLDYSSLCFSFTLPHTYLNMDRSLDEIIAEDTVRQRELNPSFLRVIADRFVPAS